MKALFLAFRRRLSKSLADCLEILGDRKAAVVRELTKLHEEIVREKLAELTGIFAQREVKGEIVLVIDREEIKKTESRTSGPKDLVLRIEELESQGLDHKPALKKAAKEFGLSRSEAYRILVSEKNISS